MTSSTWLLLVHGLLAVALLGAVSHQAVACLLRGDRGTRSFAARYGAVSPMVFVDAIIVLYIVTLLIGALIYPAYRVDVRIPLEEMALAGIVGLFELKEHFGGIGLAVLPLYRHVWLAGAHGPSRGRRMAVTALLAAIVWFDFVAGHVINNIRGL